MASLGDIIVVLGAETSQFTAKMAEARGELDATEHSGSGMASSLASGAKMLAGVAAVAIGAGVALADMAGKFESLTTQIVTGAGESVSNLGLIRNGILAMAGEVGATPDDLAKALYNIESAGFHGAAGLEVLRISAEGAKVGMADQATVADALTSALNAYHLPASDAVKITNTLIATVANGKMHLADLAGSLGAVLPIAANLKVPIDQVGAAIATMTMQGTSAHIATTGLRFLLASLAGPTSAAAAEFKALGIGEAQIPGITKSVSKEMSTLGLSTSEVADALAHQGLPAALDMITTAINKAFPKANEGDERAAALKALVGGTRGLNTALELTGANAATYAANVEKIGAAAAKGGSQVQGWALIQTDFNQKISEAEGALESAGISIGTKLLPYVGDAVKVGADLIDDLMGITAHGKDTDKVASDIAGTLRTVGGFILNDLLPPAENFALTLLHIGQWAYSTFEPPLKDFVATVGPPLIGVFKFLENNGWAVEAIFAAIAARFVIIKGLAMGKEFLSFASGFEQYAAVTGSKSQAIMAALGLGGEGGISGGISGLKKSYGELAMVSDTTADTEVLDADKVATAREEAAAAAATAEEGSYAAGADAAEVSAASQTASMGTIMNAAGLLTKALLPVAAVWMAINSVRSTTGPAFSNPFGFHGQSSIGNPLGISFGNELAPQKGQTEQGHSSAELQAAMAAMGLPVGVKNSATTTSVWNAVVAEIQKAGPLTQTELQNLVSQVAVAGGSSTAIAGSMGLLQKAITDKGQQAQVDLILYEHSLEAGGMSAAQAGKATAALQAGMGVLSGWVDKNGPLTVVQMDSFLNDMKHGATSAFDIQESLNTINLTLAPAIPYAVGLVEALATGAKGAKAIHIASGLAGGGGSFALGGLADAPLSGGIATLHGREFIVPESMASPALQAMMAAAINGQTLGPTSSSAMPTLSAGPSSAGGSGPSADAIGRAVAEYLGPALAALIRGPNRSSDRLLGSMVTSMQQLANQPPAAPAALR